MVNKLIVENYGKIGHAELKIAPLTLLVGDNNSGKSYLLSLLWAIQSLRVNSILFQGMSELEESGFLRTKEEIRQAVEAVKNGMEKEVAVKIGTLLPSLNLLLEKNKNQFVSSIFNYKKLTIGKLCLETDSDFEIKVSIYSVEGNGIRFHYRDFFASSTYDAGSLRERDEWLVMRELERMMIYILNGKLIGTEAVYLPAARTGFVLAKDVINKVGRQQAFDMVSESNTEERRVQPFTKPIIRFLDLLDSISIDNAYENSYKNLVQWIEKHLAKGSISYADTGAREVRYTPDGMKEGIPLRTSSAVVTELAPLLLILKYGNFYSDLCYEEPEMCLHPRLQLEMGRLLIRLKNQGIDVIATTHSDIILQHMNNMGKIGEMEEKKQQVILSRLGMDSEDCLKFSDVAVYQLTDCGAVTEVKRLESTENGFEVSTFSTALMDILNQSMTVEEYGAEGED